MANSPYSPAPQRPDPEDAREAAHLRSLSGRTTGQDDAMIESLIATGDR